MDQRIFFQGDRAHRMNQELHSADLKPGVSVRRRYTVDESRTIKHMGSDLAVYSTPSMVHDVEQTCHELLEPYLAAGNSTVGTRVEIDHMAPTPAGAWVEICAEVVAIDGRRVTMEAVITDAVEQVGRCRHNRFIVDSAKTAERLAQKKNKMDKTA